MCVNFSCSSFRSSKIAYQLVITPEFTPSAMHSLLLLSRSSYPPRLLLLVLTFSYLSPLSFHICPIATITALSEDNPRPTRLPPTLANFFHVHGGTYRSHNPQGYNFTTHVTTSADEPPHPPHPLPSSHQYQIANNSLWNPLTATNPTPATTNSSNTVTALQASHAAALQTVSDLTQFDLTAARAALAATPAELSAIRERLK